MDDYSKNIYKNMKPIPKDVLDYLKIYQSNLTFSEDTLTSYNILLNQYDIYKKCLDIDTKLMLYTNIAKYRALGFGNVVNICNYYVPCFFNKQIKEMQVESSLIESLSAEEVCLYIVELSQIFNALPYDKNNIHIGLFNESEVIYPAIRVASKLLENMGYMTCIIDVNSCISGFSWEDNYFTTLTVFVDLVTNREKINKKIKDFIEFDDSFTDINLGGTLIYFSYYNLDCCLDNVSLSTVEP